jgi:hypothetical protein
MNAWTAINLSPLVIGQADLLDQSFILQLSAAWLAFAPGVIAAL